MRRFYWFLLKSFAVSLLIFLSLGVALPISIYLLLDHSIRLADKTSLPDYIAATGLFISLLAIAFYNMPRLLNQLLKQQLFDNPNQRSMHTRPTPRGGGWVYVISITVAMFLFLSAALIFMPMLSAKHFEEATAIFKPVQELSIFLIGLILLTAISWQDDRHGLSARWRLLSQFVATVPVYFVFFQNTDFFYPTGMPVWLAHVCLVIFWVGFINLYNFMDGIDGITASNTITLALPLLLGIALPLTGRPILALASVSGELTDEITQIICLGLVTSSIGFLRYNWHPAKIFLGDVGSVTIGYLMGFCLIAVISAGYWYVAATLPLYYLADGGITLLRRLFKGEKIWEAHRTHFYQRAAQAAGRHDVVVLKIAACNAVLTVIAVLELLYSPWLELAAPLPVALLLYNMAHQRHIGSKQVTGTPSVR